MLNRILQSPVQTSILNRLGDVGGLDFFSAGEVGDGATDLQDSAVGAGAQAQFVDRGFKQSLGVIIHRTVALDVPCAHLGVGVDVSFLKPLQLNRACIIDPLADKLRGFAGVAAGEVLIADRRHFDLDVDAVEKRAGDPGASETSPGLGMVPPPTRPASEMV
jgi:hypothetical protein